MILNILDEIAGNASRLHKDAVLTREKDNADLREAFRLAYDPYTQFYIRKIPQYKSQDKDSLKSAMSRLSLLSSRTVTGNAGIEHLTIILGSVDAADGTVIERIIGKDLRCGVSEATINKIWPGLVHEYPVMLASERVMITPSDKTTLGKMSFSEHQIKGWRAFLCCKKVGPRLA